jgi:hypothetical protein
MSSTNPTLQNSYGPEAAPYQVLHQQPLEYDARTDAPEVVPAKGVVEEKSAAAVIPKRKMLGMRVAVFWTALVVFVAMVLGIGIGVGLGVGLKRNGDSNSPDSSSPTTTISHSTAESQTKTSGPSAQSSTSTRTTSASAVFVTSGTHGLAANSCTFTAPRTYQASGDSSFTEYCFTDWPNGVDAADGSGPIKDLVRTTVYTFEDCMEECVKYNSNLPSSGTKCGAVTYNSNLTSIIEVGKQGGNCFLKNKKGIDRQGRAESACAALVF